MLSQHALQVISQHALQQVSRGMGAIPACIAGGIPACLAAGLGEGVSRPTPKGEVEGDLVQVHSQGVKLMGIWSRPTAKGEVEGDLAGVGGGACSQGVPGLGDAWSQGGVPGPGGGAWWRPPEGYCCGRYTSYWNAFFFMIKFTSELQS